MSGYLAPRKQTRNWDHGRLFGQAAFVKNFMRNVINSGTTTDEAKALAAEIEGKLTELNDLLQTRADLEPRS